MNEISWKITPEVCFNTQEVRLKVEALGEKISTEVMKTKEDATRAALIALGWTPPGDSFVQVPDDMGYKSIEQDGPVGVALMWLESAINCKAFVWDWDQKECAEDTLRSARKWMSLIGPVPEAKEETISPVPESTECSHEMSPPEVAQDYGDRVNRACWTMFSLCKKCGMMYVHASEFGVFDALLKEKMYED